MDVREFYFNGVATKHCKTNENKKDVLKGI